jgi:hypothetical protein
MNPVSQGQEIIRFSLYIFSEAMKLPFRVLIWI